MWTVIALFFSMAITHAQDCAPSNDLDVDVSVGSDGTSAASLEYDVTTTC